jgi:hypothetical protein
MFEKRGLISMEPFSEIIYDREKALVHDSGRSRSQKQLGGEVLS